MATNTGDARAKDMVGGVRKNIETEVLRCPGEKAVGTPLIRTHHLPMTAHSQWRGLGVLFALLGFRLLHAQPLQPGHVVAPHTMLKKTPVHGSSVHGVNQAGGRGTKTQDSSLPYCPVVR